MNTARCARALALFAVVVTAHSLTMDEEAISDLISAASTVATAQQDGSVAITIRGPHGRGRREELLNIKGDEDVSVSLYYSRKSNKVTLESLHGGSLKSVSWGLGSHPRGTLVLVVSADQVKLYVSCKSLHSHAMTGSHNLLKLFVNQKVRVYHEENAPIEVYGTELAALDSLGCSFAEDSLKPPSLVSNDDEPDSDMVEIKDFIANNERNKREERMQGDDYRTNYIDENGVLPQPTTQRGDIPSNGIETCDDEVIRQLQLLRQTIDHLRREVADQKGTIDNLRGQLRQCCHRPMPTPPPVERCTGSSCYPGY